MVLVVKEAQYGISNKMASSPRRCVALYGCGTRPTSTLQRE
jgi:hypothetical protein